MLGSLPRALLRLEGVAVLVAAIAAIQIALIWLAHIGPIASSAMG